MPGVILQQIKAKYFESAFAFFSQAKHDFILAIAVDISAGRPAFPVGTVIVRPTDRAPAAGVTFTGILKIRASDGCLIKDEKDAAWNTRNALDRPQSDDPLFLAISVQVAAGRQGFSVAPVVILPSCLKPLGMFQRLTDDFGFVSLLYKFLQFESATVSK
jgi:hypothetical protein